MKTHRSEDVLDPLYLPEQESISVPVPCTLEAIHGWSLTELGVVLLEHFAEPNPLLLGVVDAVETELTRVELDKFSVGINLHVDVSIAA